MQIQSKDRVAFFWYIPTDMLVTDADSDGQQQAAAYALWI